ncbi:MAG: hypothetical protein FRX49_13338 [Trebouxia sp. A1-2]|nr:MAG: hypothetical protein FRX49_13338 [Trebouxia sp. A1-2]
MLIPAVHAGHAKRQQEEEEEEDTQEEDKQQSKKMKKSMQCEQCQTSIATAHSVWKLQSDALVMISMYQGRDVLPVMAYRMGIIVKQDSN